MAGPGPAVVDAVMVLRIEVLRVMMPSLGGAGTPARGISVRGDDVDEAASRSLSSMLFALSSESSISFTLEFLVYVSRQMKSTFRIMVPR